MTNAMARERLLHKCRPTIRSPPKRWPYWML